MVCVSPSDGDRLAPVVEIEVDAVTVALCEFGDIGALLLRTDGIMQFERAVLVSPMLDFPRAWIARPMCVLARAARFAGFGNSYVPSGNADRARAVAQELADRVGVTLGHQPPVHEHDALGRDPVPRPQRDSTGTPAQPKRVPVRRRR